ncbi:hypothetical protein V8G54_003201 [Vigna mungo]|uniref:Uncharacterized protein n=1 Tax=Vigna mungo TaxID=3915 RepID=A0AAQ3PBM1_VIGMU
MKGGCCSNRAESLPLNTTTKSLVLMNYFRNVKNSKEACRDNSSPLLTMMKMCFTAAGNRWPNYVAVNFYKVKFLYHFENHFLNIITSIISYIFNETSREVTVVELLKH